MELTNKIIKKDSITTLMVTHNIKDALHTGNKTIVMSGGKIVLILEGKEREQMTVPELM